MESTISFIRLIFLALVPYVLASQGTMLAGRAGVFIVAQEGVMLAAASLGFLAANATQNLFVGLIAAALVGGLFGWAIAYFTTTLRLNQFVVGLAMYFIGLGVSTLAFKIVIGITLQMPRIATLPSVRVPLFGEIPLIGDILFNHNVMVYFSAMVTLALYYFLFRTSWGLDLRAVGENPKSADSLGINVVRTRYAACIVGGMLMGLAGVYLPMVYTGTFTQGITAGRGWLSSALTFFGGWQPQFIFAGSFLFAVVDVLASRAQVAGTFLPHQFLRMLPYVVTLLTMVFAFRWARVPAFLGKNYDREKRSV